MNLWRSARRCSNTVIRAGGGRSITFTEGDFSGREKRGITTFSGSKNNQTFVWLLRTNVAGSFQPGEIGLSLKCGLDPSALLLPLETGNRYSPKRNTSSIPLDFSSITL